MTDRTNHDIALNCCALLDEFHGCESHTRPFYEVEDLTVKAVLGKGTTEFDAEIHGFFGCGDDVTDALLRLEYNLKHQVKNAKLCLSARARAVLGLR